MKGVFDEHTNRVLFELESRNHFDELSSPWEVGKESNVFLAKKGAGKVIVKIYRVQNCDFNKMYSYIRQDPRYAYLKGQRRAIVFAWVQREYRNLLLAEQAGVLAPKPMAVRDNILVEEMIGDKEPAAMLKDAYPKNPPPFLKAVVENMKKLYQHGLIHGDLSSFNILNYDEKPYLIDFSQSTTVKAPNAKELLERDVKNIVIFFRRLGVEADVEEVLGKVKS